MDAIVNALRTLPEVSGVLLFGSRNIPQQPKRKRKTDLGADVDLFVLCSPDIPASSARAYLWKDSGVSEFTLGASTPGWDSPWAPVVDTFVFEDTAYDIVFNTLTWVQRVIDPVIHDGAIQLPEMPFRPYTVAGLIRTGQRLHDPSGAVAMLQRRVAIYPDTLRRRILSTQRIAQSATLADLDDVARRKIGATSFLFHLTRAVDSLATQLFAINRVYDPAVKRIETALADLPILPRDFGKRYGKLLRGPFTGRGQSNTVLELAALQAEVDTLARKTDNETARRRAAKPAKARTADSSALAAMKKTVKTKRGKTRKRA
jgi:hypothetical protein